MSTCTCNVVCSTHLSSSLHWLAEIPTNTMAMSAAEPSAALPKCGDMGVGHGNLERLHQLVCIISYMVSVLSEGQGKGGG